MADVYAAMDQFAGVENAGPIAGLASARERSSDRRLLRDARRGSAEAVDALIERHWDRAHRLAYGILGDAHAAEDVTQEAMLSIVGSLGRFDPYRPFAPWFHTVVSNRALDWARANARRAESPTDPLSVDSGFGELADSGADGSGGLGAGERCSRAEGADPALEAALAKLSPEHRTVVLLRFVAGYGPKQIGQILGVPTGTIGSRLRRALDQLRSELEVEDE